VWSFLARGGVWAGWACRVYTRPAGYPTRVAAPLTTAGDGVWMQEPALAPKLAKIFKLENEYMLTALAEARSPPPKLDSDRCFSCHQPFSVFAKWRKHCAHCGHSFCQVRPFHVAGVRMWCVVAGEPSGPRQSLRIELMGGVEPTNAAAHCAPLARPLAYCDEKVANREIGVRHFVIENGY
jgi:hypothetical protein